MRGTRFAVAGALVVGMVTMTQAQFRQPGGGGGGGPTFLVTNKAVQEDLKVTDEQAKQLKEWSEKFREKSREIMKEKGVEIGGKGGFGKIDDEMRKKLNEANAEVTKVAYQQLGDVLTKEQVERVKQISRQQMGMRVFSDPEVVAALNLTDSQKSSLEGLSGDFQKESREVFGDFGKGKFDREKFQESQTKVEKIQKEYTAKMTDVLDDTQKAKYKELIGTPFDTAQLRFGGFTPKKKQD
jgi:Spy/CpxP family protein refolding chaperone